MQLTRPQRYVELANPACIKGKTWYLNPHCRIVGAALPVRKKSFPDNSVLPLAIPYFIRRVGHYAR